MRNQLVGLVIAAPLFAASAVLNAAATNEAADQFSSGQRTLSTKEAKPNANPTSKDKGAK